MGMKVNSQWKAITESRFAWEREALDFLRERLPDHEPWRAWTNFEFIADDGTTNEVDALIFSPRGLFFIEIKSRPGILSGDGGCWTWKNDGRSFTDDNPLLAANRKAKKLASLLRRRPSAAKAKGPLPFIEALIFCNNVTEVGLSGHARSRLCLADRPATDTQPARPGIIAALTDRIADGLSPEPDLRLNTEMARVISRCIDESGVRASRRSQEVNGYRIDRLLCEGPAFQDRLGIHRTFEKDRRRVRLFLSAVGSSQEHRAIAARAAEREYQILRGLDHTGILRPNDFQDGDFGTAILFEYDPTAVRLDHYVKEHYASMSVDERLDLLRQ
ncbi:MAG: NERD domain-containing protein, partial [Planctomycetota bacterium]|nr:NERD domain-containing protein [Planctomycetota bacterium]